MSARTDEIQHGQTAPKGRPFRAFVGLTSILVVVAGVPLAYWLSVRPDAWDKAEWGQLKGLNMQQVQSLRGDPDPVPMIAGWDMTFTEPLWFEGDTCLAIRFQDDTVVDWAVFSGDLTAPEPNWRLACKLGSER